MSALDQKQPSNLNFLSPLNFKFVVKRLPHVTWFLQKVNIPGITLPPAKYANPFTNLPQPGDHIEWNKLQITFKVDEDLQNYMEIFNWIVGQGFPNNYGQFKSLAQGSKLEGLGVKSELALSILNSAYSDNKVFIFSDAFPISVSDLFFGTTDVNVNYVTAEVTFVYAYFYIEDQNA